MIFYFFFSSSLTQMQAQSSSELLLSRKRKRDGSNGEMEEGERTGKIPRCTVVSQPSQSSRSVRLYPCPNHSDCSYTLTYVCRCDQRIKSESLGTNVTLLNYRSRAQGHQMFILINQFIFLLS